jgi:hypothetical protein
LPNCSPTQSLYDYKNNTFDEICKQSLFGYQKQSGSNTLLEPTRKALELFIEKARKLESFRFVKFAEENKLHLHISMEMDGSATKIDQQFPDDEDVVAFTNALRLFLQAGNQVSFPWLAKKVLIDAGISDNWKEQFKEARTSLNNFLDAITNVV